MMQVILGEKGLGTHDVVEKRIVSGKIDIMSSLSFY
jgi:hypothetical protein